VLREARNARREAGSPPCAVWKGLASYHDVVVDGNRNADAAWYYPEPKEAAAQIAGYLAFWRGVTVEQGRAPADTSSA